MTITIRHIVAPQLISDGVISYYTADKSVPAHITQATVTNVAVASRDLTVYIVPDGGVANNSTLFIKELTIAAGETRSISEMIGHVIPGLTSIRAFSSDDAASLNLCISGYARSQ